MKLSVTLFKVRPEKRRHTIAVIDSERQVANRHARVTHLRFDLGKGLWHSRLSEDDSQLCLEAQLLDTITG